ncbi:hypothetical protein M0805_007963 [Coniferiporia weirii]|nr:hypothetical protein M0805_007963 [Coniferiporia weirii]
MVDASEVGKYGSIRLLKRREPSTVIASYPIDEEEVTFGRDPSCNVRLYYQWVSSLHCKLIFDERKAFLQVLGANGVIVDGCQVYPAKSTESAPTTVPLPNGSTFEIHKKRFLFNYPPKELRPQLFTPGARTKRRGSLRMSMVHSAHVFSPAPSPNPRENLRVLQSPLKLASLAEDAPVTLVDGNHPRVFEEDQDLVILEDVEPKQAFEPQSPTPVRSQNVPALPRVQSPQQQLQPQTPRRRSAPSLHRAVLIRSAQRVAYMQEMHSRLRTGYGGSQFEEINLDEDVAEEEEVEEFVNSDPIEGEELEKDMSDADEQHSTNEDDPEDVEDEMEEDDGGNERDITEAQDDYQEQSEEAPPARYSTPLQVSRTFRLGAFMTPQPGLFTRQPLEEGGEDQKQKVGPQRPPPGYRFSLAPGLGAGTMSLKLEDGTDDTETGHEDKVTRPPSPIKSRPEITAEERKAILERRKSAHKAPEPEFAGHVPGLGARRTSALPAPGPIAPTSPFKSIREDIEEGEDTQSVLKRMEESLATMRRKSMARRSLGVGRGVGLSSSPEKEKGLFSLLASVAPSPVRGWSGRAGAQMLRFDDAIMEEAESRPRVNEPENKHEDTTGVYADADESGGGDEDETEMDEDDEHDENAFPAHPLPHMAGTPRMDGLKEMFRAPQAPIGLATPAVRGLRELFREKTKPSVLQTPRMDGMRSLFTERRPPRTPAYDGIEEMMHLDEAEEGEGDSGEVGEDERSMPVDVPEDVVDDSQLKAQDVALPRAPQTVLRGKTSRLVRATLTDSSTMADDEATPDSGAAPVPKRRLASRAGKAGEDAAVVHRTSRVRRTAGVDSAVGETARTKLATTAARRVAKSTEDNTSTELEKSTGIAARKGRTAKTSTDSEVPDAATKPKPKGRSRKPESSATATETEAEVAPAKAPVVRRGTRARSRSVDPEGDTNVGGDASASSEPLDTIGRSSPEGASSTASATTKARRGARTKAAAVETIQEEEEPAPAKPLRKTGVAAMARARRTRAETEASRADVLQQKKDLAAAKAQEHVDSDDATRKENKENTPERSPVSPSEAVEDVPVKAVRSRAAPKAAAPAARTRPIASRAVKPPSKTVKVKEEEPVVALRATRARARK